MVRAAHFLSTSLLILVGCFDIGVQSFTPSPRNQQSLSSSRGVSFTPPFETKEAVVRKNQIAVPGKPVILDITCPDDLRNFVDMDDRVCVIKVYADWCKTCKHFDIRYRKVASTWGTTYGPNIRQNQYTDSVRFAQMEFGENEEICNLLGATKLPYILVYKRQGGKIAGFTCPPSKAQLLVNVLQKHVTPSNPLAFNAHDANQATMERILVERTIPVGGIVPYSNNLNYRQM